MSVRMEMNWLWQYLTLCVIVPPSLRTDVYVFIDHAWSGREVRV
jgi:hypothetical protein